MSKGQMEMIGLVVIVILLTLGMLFMVQFALNEHPEKKIFTRKGLAYSTISAIMKTTVDDSNCVQGFNGEVLPQMGKDLLEDCAVNYQTSPEGYSLYRCDNLHSCHFVQNQTKLFLEETLVKWNKKHEFKSELVVPGSSKPIPLVLIKYKGGCPTTRERDSSELFFLQTDAGLVESVLYLCD